MALVVLVPIVVVLIVIGTALWVYTDASARAERGEPVNFSVGSIQLDSPLAWAVVSLVLWAVCFPLYLASRNHPG